MGITAVSLLVCEVNGRNKKSNFLNACLANKTNSDIVRTHLPLGCTEDL